MINKDKRYGQWSYRDTRRPKKLENIKVNCSTIFVFVMSFIEGAEINVPVTQNHKFKANKTRDDQSTIVVEFSGDINVSF
jgi:hypothetical protein